MQKPLKPNARVALSIDMNFILVALAPRYEKFLRVWKIEKIRK